MANTINTNAPRQHLAHALLFWCTAIALLFAYLGTTAAWQSEDRWLEIAREMQLSGNYFRPALNGELYFDKPLLSYWLIIASKWLLGELNEWSLRLPSALAGLLALWATIDLAKHLWSAEVARKAGWILLSSFGFLQWARLGEADMENLAASILAVSWYWRHRDRPSLPGYIGFYAIVAIGAQCKGLTAIVVPLLAILPDLLRGGRLRRHISARHLVAITAGAALYFVPFWLAHKGVQVRSDASAHSGLALVLRENVVRYVAPFDHKEPVYTYLIAVPQYLFPWSLLFIAALYGVARGNAKTIAHRGWLLSAIALIFAFFTLSGSRRNYYILPLLPYCALLCAAYLQQAPGRVAMRLTAIVLSVVGVVYLLILPCWSLLQQHAYQSLPDALRWQVSATGALLLAVLALLSWRAQREPQWFHVCAAGAVIWLASFFFHVQLVLDDFRSEAAFARQLAPLAAAYPDARVATYRERPGGKLLFYANLPPSVSVLKNPEELRAFVEDRSAPRLVLAYHRYDAELPPLLRAIKPQLIEKEFAWEKNNREKMQAWLIPQ